jgi:hypothetical protein
LNDVGTSLIRNYTSAYDVNISVNKLKISIEDICSRMSDSPKPIDAHFHETINDIILHLPEKCRINAGYIIYPAYFDRTWSKNFKIDDTFFNMGKIVTNQLKKSEQAAVFACTIGPTMENWSRQIMETGESVQSYLIDMIASAMTEKAVDYLHDYISAEMAKNNLKITNRYSPGYCDWPVSDQHQIFSLMPDNFCGISLNSSALMNPIKSVSGVIGIGANVKFEEYLCNRCNLKDCTYRKKHMKISNALNKGIAL